MASERQIENAFIKGVRSITDAIKVTRLREAIDAHDYNAVLDIVDIDDAAFDEMRGLIMQTYAEAGTTEISKQRFPVPVRWNSANPRVEEFARNQIGGDITNITESMRQAVRETVADGYAFGRSPNKVALDIAGRVDASGTRKGGIVGLNAQQAQWVANMRRALEEGPSSALRYGLRDRRFDALLRRSEALTQEQIDRITRQYSNKLLLSRGKAIAVTERGLAVNGGLIEAWRQAAERVGFDVDRLVKEWRHTGRAVEDRPGHLRANGQKVTGLNTNFTVNGVPMIHPHDPNAPASEVVNCRCEVKIKWRV